MGFLPASICSQIPTVVRSFVSLSARTSRASAAAAAVTKAGFACFRVGVHSFIRSFVDVVSRRGGVVGVFVLLLVVVVGVRGE